nr:hypothetical protein BaRGS_032166 [Batillaria attramentaria]
MDGEKDPRNLMLAFRCAQIVCNHFNLGAMEEDMFEVTACYFPIDFVPEAGQLAEFMAETLPDHGKYSSPKGRQIFDNSAALLASLAVNKDTAERLISLLEDKVLGLKAAEGFSTILATFPDVLCVAVRATVTPTFQQRFLVQNLPRLVSGFHNAQPGPKY